MIIECITNRVGDLAEADRKHVRQCVHDDEVHLAHNRQYVAYGVILRAGFPWFLICEEDDSGYPTPHYAGFFKVIDGTIPFGWSFQWQTGPWHNGAFIPTEWCKPLFFEALLDGGADETALFQSKKAEIDSVSRTKR